MNGNMKISILSALILIISIAGKSQTWTGNTSTDWNTSTNWSGNAVPLPAGNVTIPTSPAGNRWPKLAAATTVNNFTMAAGAELDVNGFGFTVSSTIDLRGTINNTKAATDITFTINGPGTSFLRNLTVNDNITYNINGTGTFYDTYLSNTANAYSGNVSYLRNGAGAIYVAYYSRNNYSGNVILKATALTTNESFLNGSDIAGNLTVESVGGSITIGAIAHSTQVGGTLNITGTTSGVFNIRRIINQQNGGNISLTNRSSIDIQNDTIRVNTINISGHTSSLDLSRNTIIGNIVYSSAIAATATSYVRNNIITGNVSYELNGTQTFYDNYLANTANSYSGNVSYLRNGAGSIYVAYYSRNTYGGNVDIKSTVALTNESFIMGSDITGNLTIESVGGNATIGALAHATKVGGTLNISGTTSGVFNIRRILNQQNGGNITLTNRSHIDIQNDTIQVNSINITGHTGSLDVSRNSITGSITYSDINSTSATSFVKNNFITGNASYTLNGTATFYDTYLPNTSNNYSGNVSYIRNGTGALYVGYYDTVYVGGNLTFNYSLPGTVDNRFIAFHGTGPSVLNQDGLIPLQLQRLSVYKTGTGNLTLNDSLRIINNVYFAGGNIVTANQKELILLNGATAVGANDASKVLGPIVKIGAQAFSFPIGGPTHLQGVSMTAPVGVTTRFRAEYVPANPHPTYDTAQRAAGLARISTCEYWRVDREIGATNVTLTFDYGNPCACVEVPANLRVARWSGSQWTNLGNGMTTGNTQGGAVQSAAAVVDYGIFTLGTSATVAPSVSIVRNVANPVCKCRWVTFTATPQTAGCNPSYQWKKNGQNIGTNSSTYSDSALAQGDIISVVITSSAAFAQPATQTSNSFNISTTDLNAWTGITSNNWHTPTNWSCQAVPCTLTKVTIPGGTPNPATIMSGNVTVISLTAQNGSTVNAIGGAKLTLTGQ
jgi:hypothetical protein